MAVYFQGNPPEIQVPDGLQTLVLMNPNYVHQYSDTPTPQTTNNLVFLNSNSNSNSAHALHSPHSQQLVGIPLSAAATPAAQESLHGLLHRVHYNLYNPIDPSAGARETPRAQQGLSLTLSSQQQQQPNSNYGPAAASQDIRVSAGWGSSGSGVTNGASSSGMHGVLLSSKYLKAAQELLDEVVNVNNMMSNKGADQLHRNGSGNNNSSSSKAIGESSSAGEAAGKRSVELSTAERQEIQMKKAKLINMLDEVEQRYKQYHEQMQMVIATFEQAAGIGTARTYTALALKTISRQFRCLKDAITGQIRACSKSLGEEDSKIIEGSRLKFVDNHFRQQRALQHLGMIQHNAWRPQRGLPERSVSVLRAWLFEHFLHPYPKDSDKQMLAKQTGLTRSQVSNWFINARVRLWKPMVEEMYLEEIKEQEQSGASENKVTRKCPPKNEDTSFSPTHETKAKQDMNQNHQINETAATTNIAGDQPGFSLMDMEGMAPASPKRLRSSGCNEMMLQSPGAGSCMSSINMDKQQRVGRDEYSFMGTHTDFMGSFGQYPIDIGGGGGRFDETEHHHHHQQQQQQFTTPRFSGNNGVSLTLGLPHCDNLSLSGAHHHHHHHHQGFLQNPNTVQIMGRQMNHDQFGAAAMSASTNTAAFENIQNGKRFAAHLLHDFVA